MRDNLNVDMAARRVSMSEGGCTSHHILHDLVCERV